jgi:hypothetical protein
MRPNFFQAKSKSSQIRASSSKVRTKLSQRKSFNFLRRIELSQGLTPTPRAFFISCAPSRPKGGQGGAGGARSPRDVGSFGPHFRFRGLFAASEGLATFSYRGRSGGIGPTERSRSLVARKREPSTDQKPEDRDKTGRSIRRPAEMRPLERSPNRFRTYAKRAGASPSCLKSISRTPAL